MKKKNLKKLLLAVCCAALLVCVSIGATVAYLTSNDKVENTFTVGKVKITLDEAATDVYGNPVTITEVDGKEVKSPVDDVASATRVKANTYKLLPGHEYTKDPTIHVADGSEDCWLFVKVENGIVDIEAATNKIVDQMTKDSNWTLVAGTQNVYAYKTTVSANTDVKVFDGFKINDNVDGDTLAKYEGKTIVVTAYAIQADGFNTAAAAWAAAKF